MSNKCPSFIKENETKYIQICMQGDTSCEKDYSRQFCGDYHPLNQQTRWDAFPMILMDHVLTQLGKSQWYFAFDL